MGAGVIVVTSAGGGAAARVEASVGAKTMAAAVVLQDLVLPATMATTILATAAT